jgi:cysteine desulfurase/selenocysteine lyase
MPVMERFGVPATVRASLALYNTPAELDALALALGKAQELLG